MHPVCERKKSYLSEEVARGHASMFNHRRTPRKHVKPYQCPHCGLWHLTHAFRKGPTN